ncbi:MAG: SMP-30/gluconolactonase/LRE family protein [Anaerolineae bacterium]
MSDAGRRWLKRLEARWAATDRRQRIRVAVLAGLLLLLINVSSLWVYYARTRKPLPAVLPPAPAVARAFKPHFLFSIYDVEEPVGVAVTPQGDRVYVVESGGERQIHVFDRDGNPLFTFAPPESKPLECAPVYITLDADGKVYVSDRRRHTIDIYTPDGDYQGQVSAPTPDGYWAPLGVSFVGGQLYVTDVTKHEHRVMVLTPAGELLMSFGKEGKEPGQFWFPNDVAVDAKGRLYVSDGNNGRLQVFDPDGQFLYELRGLSLPRGMAIDADRLYVVDAVGQGVNVYDISGEVVRELFIFGDFGIEDGRFNFPNDIAVDETGRLYIADRVNNRVQVWSY